jgi:FdhD protein
LKRFSQPYAPEGTEPAGVRPWPIRRLSPGHDQIISGGVVVEEPLQIVLGGHTVAVLMRTPGLEKELATGFCLGEGLVADLKDVALVRHCGRALASEDVEQDPLDESRNRVDLVLAPGATPVALQPEVTQLIRSGCGRVNATDVASGLAPIRSELRVGVETLHHLLGQMTRQQEAYRAAGGVHAAALFDSGGRAIVVCEDVGRHNAVDKATGYCLLRGIPLADKILVSTGRASYDMVAKGVRLGIPILVSVSSPTSLALDLAQALSCTLVGYLRGKALNIYTHDWRIAG